MIEIKTSVDVKDDEGNTQHREATVTKDFGSNLAEMTELFGEDIVFRQARANMVIGLQGIIRTRLKQDDYRKAKFQEIADEWTPSTRQKKSAIEKATPIIESMSEAEREQLIALLKASVEE